MTDTAINLNDKLARFSEHWSPGIVADFNGYDVMVVKVKGEFNWHSHADTDDFFLVLKGSITIRLRDKDLVLGEGELFVVPRSRQAGTASFGQRVAAAVAAAAPMEPPRLHSWCPSLGRLGRGSRQNHALFGLALC